MCFQLVFLQVLLMSKSFGLEVRCHFELFMLFGVCVCK